MQKISLLLIDLYQNFISPYKGYSCAHRIATGEVGCSGYGKKVISRFGFKTGYALLQRRFAECKCSSDELKKEAIYKPRKKYVPSKMGYQRGECDCGDCDMPNCDGPDCGKNCSPFDLCDIGDCGSDKRNANNEKYQQRVQKKIEKKKAKDESKKVSLDKGRGSYDDSDGDGGD